MSELQGQFDDIEERLGEAASRAFDPAASPEARRSAKEQAEAAREDLAEFVDKAEAAGESGLAEDATRLLADADAKLTQLVIPDPPASTPDNTLEGAAGSGGATETHAGIDFPIEPLARDSLEALASARCAICKHLHDEGDGAETRDELNRLIAKMILAEDQILEDWARRHVPYSEADHEALAPSYDALEGVRDELDRIAENNPKAAELRDNLNFLEQTYGALKDCLEDVDDSSVKKGTGKAKKAIGDATNIQKKVNQVKFNKVLEKTVKDAQKSNSDIIRKFSKTASGLKAEATKTASKAIKAGGVGKLAESVGAGALGLMAMLHEITQAQLIEVESELGADAGVVRDARNALAKAKADIRARRLTEAKAEIDAELAKDGKPPFELHRMSDVDMRNYLDGKLMERGGGDRIAEVHGHRGMVSDLPPTSDFGDFYRKQGTLFDDAARQALCRWCKEHCDCGCERDRRVGMFWIGGGLLALLILALVLIVAYAGTGGDGSTDDAAGESSAESQESSSEPVPPAHDCSGGTPVAMTEGAVDPVVTPETVRVHLDSDGRIYLEICFAGPWDIETLETPWSMFAAAFLQLGELGSYSGVEQHDGVRRTSGVLLPDETEFTPSAWILPNGNVLVDTGLTLGDVTGGPLEMDMASTKNEGDTKATATATAEVDATDAPSDADELIGAAESF